MFFVYLRRELRRRLRQAIFISLGLVITVTAASPASGTPGPVQRAWLALAQGDAGLAARWAQQWGLSPDGELAYARERDYLVLARVLLAQDQPAAALGLLDRLRAFAQSQGRAGSVIEIAALQALALAASGDDPAAAGALAAALALASEQGYVRVFADEGAPMAALPGRVAAAARDGHTAAQQVPLGYLAAMLRARGPPSPAAAPGRDGRTTVPGLIEPLTSREMEELHLLAAGSPNQRIAEDLVVTLDTVKKHVTHVLSKLGAANRTEAVARARQLGLIPWYQGGRRFCVYPAYLVSSAASDRAAFSSSGAWPTRSR